MDRLPKLKSSALNPRRAGLWKWTYIFLSLYVLVSTVSFRSTAAPAKRREYLTPSEIDQIRDAQDINDRVPLFVGFAELRLKEAGRLAGIAPAEKSKEDGRKRDTPKTWPVKSPKDEPVRTITDSLNDYVSIYEEMLRRLEENVDQGVDCRKALKALLKGTLEFQAGLQMIAKKLGEEAPESLEKALNDAATALEAGRKTLAEQEEKFKEEKKQKKEANRDKRN